MVQRLWRSSNQHHHHQQQNYHNHNQFGSPPSIWCSISFFCVFSLLCCQSALFIALSCPIDTNHSALTYESIQSESLIHLFNNSGSWYQDTRYDNDDNDNNNKDNNNKDNNNKDNNNIKELKIKYSFTYVKYPYSINRHYSIFNIY